MDLPDTHPAGFAASPVPAARSPVVEIRSAAMVTMAA